MSHELYYRRLTYYAGRGGIAKEGDLTIRLNAAPPVLSTATEIEFGEIHCGVQAYEPFVRDNAYDPRRPMTPPEIVAVSTWLASLARAVASILSVPHVHTERRK